VTAGYRTAFGVEAACLLTAGTLFTLRKLPGDDVAIENADVAAETA